MSPLVIIIIIVLGVMVLTLPKKYVAIPILISICYVTIGPRITIAGADFTISRIMIIISLVRIFSRAENSNINSCKLDKLMMLYVLFTLITGTLRNQSLSGFVNRGGVAFDAIGFYYIMRTLFSDEQNIDTFFKILAIILIPLAVLMLLEQQSGRNPFSIFGGVRDYSAMRNGRVRAAGPFMHAILAGTVAAAAFPYIATLWYEKKKYLFSAGMFAVLAIVFSSASSGPIMSLFFGMVGMLCWICRNKMRQIRKGLFYLLITLEIVMEAHVWYLIARIDLTGSSTGYHRAQIITTALDHLHEWWLIGTNYTRHWMPTGVSWSPDHTDITNQYVLIGVNGGLISLVFFVLLIIAAFQSIGIGLQNSQSTIQKRKMWSVGSVLFVHMITFLTVAYFDQSITFFYITLALAASYGSMGYITNKHSEKKGTVHAAFA